MSRTQITATTASNASSASSASNASTETLKQELLHLLEAQDRKALRLIGLLKKRGMEQGDEGLTGYAYYRYAYYYYFLSPDIRKFRKYLLLAIRTLVRAKDPEYLASAYNLVGYDAQDHGCYDIAFAYYSLAVKTAAPVAGISLPGLIEANAGRLHVELNHLKEGRVQIRRALKHLSAFRSMHVYHYNMIITYADEALASFLLRDLRSCEKALQNIRRHYDQANENEKDIGGTYRILPELYVALLASDRPGLKKALDDLFAFWTAKRRTELSGLIFEVEAIFHALLDGGYTGEARRFLHATEAIEHDESLSAVLRYDSLKIRYYQQTGNAAKLRQSLISQHEIHKQLQEERSRMQRYALDFVDMIQEISGGLNEVREHNELLYAQANTDALTRLPNRNALNKHLSGMLHDARAAKHSFGICFIDIDHFKQFNDTYGHQAGDACLRLIGQVLKDYTDESRMFCARYGGDEFIICFSGMTPDDIRSLMAAMEETIAKQRISLHQKKIPEIIRISFGVYCAVPDGRIEIWDYLRAADTELYRSKKKRGKDRSGQP